jgi:hypothetical protein
MKKAIIAGLTLTALAFASVGPAVAGTVDSAYISPPEKMGNPTTLRATTATAKETNHIGHSACTCCSCTTAVLEKKSAFEMVVAPAQTMAKPGVITYDTALTTSFRVDKAKGAGDDIYLITMADHSSMRPGGVALGKLDATSGNSNAPQLLAGTASLTCAPPGITLKI